jgi:multiple antibiotic resistance protein
MNLFLLMLILLNPFSQSLYLKELMDQMTLREFAAVHARATILSFSVFVVFATFGEPILTDIFQVRLASLQIFGGLVNIYIAYRFITVGPGSNVLFRGSVADLAPTIALPYMVGPGTLWTSILMGHRSPLLVALGMIAGVLLINTIFVMFSKWLFDHTSAQKETMVGKYFSVLMRTVALLVGGVGVEMLLRGVEEALRQGATPV